ncbi:MAG: choice-of-anchor J domain-containing protein [Fluviicola sp.]|nr:choice-of-anchor J domain-containing protein [Fluviicola sp.]
MRKATIKGAIVAIVLALTPFANVNAQAFTENFDNITLLAGGGWTLSNVSTPVGATGWTQGPAISGGGPFDAFNGATNAYISANFNNTGSTGTISNWLVTPLRTFKNGDVITFYTRKAVPDTYADRLEVRLSTNGASANVGSGAAVGDFTTLLLSVNPALVLGVYPTTWTQYTITISGLAAPTSGRIGFRYFVTGGGSLGANSDFIGLDNIIYTPYVCPTFTLTAAGPLLSGTAGSAYTNTLTQSGALGTPTFAVTAGALPGGLTLSTAGVISGTPTATGTFNFTVTVSDASGCTGIQSYSILIGCPANPTSLNGLPTLCNNAGAYNLTQGAPAGGSYSGTGVTGSSFNPAFGTQTITYNYTDAYACPHSSSNTITVNTAPTVTQSSIAATCDNSGLLALSGGSPAGGSYSGTGVTGSNFDPASGTQTVTYSYTDGNGCSNTASTSITVNASPSVTQSALAAVCDNSGLLALSGGSPAGGTYSGTGVTGSDFDPSSGTQTVSYNYTDGNGCSNTASTIITVNSSPTVAQGPLSTCDNVGPFALTGGSPAGGSYSGVGVSAGNFDPSSGSQTVTYSYTDANGCSNTASTLVTVNGPVVTQNQIPDVCSDAAPFALTGGLPAGGTYSGTGVTAGNFNPTAGSQVITYTYTDGNGCSNEATTGIVVNTTPTVSLILPVATLCVYNNALTLSGGSPASGTYSGTGVAAGSFNPATAGSGTHTITYDYTDANGCSNSATDNILVDACLGINEVLQENRVAYPNPSNGLFTVSMEANNQLTNLKVVDLQGKTMNAALTVQGTEVVIDLTKASNGVYVLQGLSNGELVTVRLVKN